ncbi:MAG: class I SAM-dependent methyltransferase [Spiribacter salinus]|uniref:Class I SAM-dependent methyltransferase n=1 Tax=Spiribacter salinus TaxID=1335746 RepID=A0A540VNY3_9GAMM|nr:MAG: class I SAM-dependent methyltransferase [Spiribacter salinus]
MPETELTGIYDSSFYESQRGGSERSAKVIVPIILETFSVESVVDFGCGVGSWLKEFADAGISEILGLEGGDVPAEVLKIPREKFQIADFTKDISVRSFDLSIALEVAEHLPECFADHFVRLLTDAAPVVMFSAAIPGQGGTHHVNERWQSYWCEKFAQHNYVPLDVIRPKIWDNELIPFWYRQNRLVFCHQKTLPETGLNSDRITPLDLVHPELWLTRLQSEEKRRRNQYIPRPRSIIAAFQTISLSLKVILRRIVARLSPDQK